jgi:hypothetical protein
MKTLYWILGFATLIGSLQYGLFKENGQARNFELPVRES